MENEVPLEELRVLFTAAGLAVDDALMREVLPEVAALRKGLARLRQLPWEDEAPAGDFRLDPEVWR